MNSSALVPAVSSRQLSQVILRFEKQLLGKRMSLSTEVNKLQGCESKAIRSHPLGKFWEIRVLGKSYSENKSNTGKQREEINDYMTSLKHLNSATLDVSWTLPPYGPVSSCMSLVFVPF